QSASPRCLRHLGLARQLRDGPSYGATHWTSAAAPPGRRMATVAAGVCRSGGWALLRYPAGVRALIPAQPNGSTERARHGLLGHHTVGAAHPVGAAALPALKQRQDSLARSEILVDTAIVGGGRAGDARRIDRDQERLAARGRRQRQAVIPVR